MNSLTTRSLTASTAIALVLAGYGLSLADVRASLSQRQVAMGDSFALSLEVTGGQDTTAPDLSPLQRDFTIEGTSQSSQTNVINGAVSRSHGWTIMLSPKATGKFTVPAITVGSESSRSLSIDVVDASSLPRADLANSGVQVDMTVPDGTYYVQQEIPVTVRVMAGEGLRNAELSEPSGPDLIVKQSGDDKSYQATVGGKPVSVIERTYLVTPQKSGEITLPPATLRGYVDDPDARRSPFGRDDPFETIRKQFGMPGFGSSLFDSFMNPGREIVARSKPITLDIAARPGSQAGWFLPAKNVELKSEWQPAKPEFRVGEANSKIVQVVALGASKEQLPDLTFRDVDGARIYVDRVDDRSVDTDQGTAAIKQYTLSIVPTRGGAVTLPQVEVKWLDAGSGEQKVATLPAETIEVAGAAGASAKSGSPAAASSANGGQTVEPAARDRVAAELGSRQAEFLGGVALALVGAIGLVTWWRLRRRAASARPGGTDSPAAVASPMPTFKPRAPKQDAAAAALRRACRQNDARKAFVHLKEWIAASRVNVQSLSSNAAQSFRAELAGLESRLYSQAAGEGWNGRALLDAFDAVCEETGSGPVRGSATGNLPPLYAGQSGRRRAA